MSSTAQVNTIAIQAQEQSALAKAAAVLDAANAANPLPEPKETKLETVLVDPKKDQIKFDLKTDSLNPEEKPVEQAPPPKEEKKEEEPQKVEEKKDEKLSQRFATLARKEKQLFQKTLSIKEEEGRVSEKLSAIENFEKFRKDVAKNPMLALKELGITYDQLTQFVLNGNMPNSSQLELDSVREEIKQLRQQQEEDKNTERQRQETQRQRAQAQHVQKTIDAFKQEIRDTLKSNTERFELVDLYKRDDLVYQVIEAHFEKTQGREILPIEKGLEIVEKHLEQQVELAKKAKKFQGTGTLPPKEEAKASPPAPQQRTMSNNMNSSAPSFLPAKTEKERMARALAKLSETPQRG